MLLVSVNPDLVSAIGHNLYLDRELASESAARNWAFAAWGNRHLPAAVLREHLWIEPVFRDTSHAPVQHDAAHRQRFRDDLLSAVERRQTGEVVLFIYGGHPCQIGSFFEVLDTVRDPQLRVIFNLYAAHWDFDETSAQFQFLAQVLAQTLHDSARYRDRFVLTSDSEFVAREAQRCWGSDVPVLPFFSLARRTAAQAKHPDAPVTAVYPSSVNHQRGFFLFPEMLRHCRRALEPPVRFVFRTCAAESALTVEEMQVCREVEQLGGELRFGPFSDHEMSRFFEEADILLNSYSARFFKSRTSGNVADALVFGVPIVAAQGTWAGRLVEQFGCGESFRDGDPVSLAQAVLRVAKHIADYKQRAAEAGSRWARENNVAALVDAIAKLR